MSTYVNRWLGKQVGGRVGDFGGCGVTQRAAAYESMASELRGKVGSALAAACGGVRINRFRTVWLGRFGGGVRLRAEYKLMASKLGGWASSATARAATCGGVLIKGFRAWKRTKQNKITNIYIYN